MSVKTVDDIEIFRKSGCHLGKIRGASAADEKNIDLIFEAVKIGGEVNTDAVSCDPNAFGISSCENSHEFRIVIENAFYRSVE